MIGSREDFLAPICWRNERVSRLILGTAQLGMDYGIANRRGKPDRDRAEAIIAAAWECGIRHFDTAQAYGDSEAVLGVVLDGLGFLADARVSSKLASDMDPGDAAAVSASIERTFARLRVERLWCLMLHRAWWLEHWARGLGELLFEYRRAGRIDHIGVSLTRPEEAGGCLAHRSMEILQVACNAWDRRMIGAGVFETASRRGKLCCVRSIYLQGLLVMAPDAVASRLPRAQEASACWHEEAGRLGMPPAELAVRFALALDAPLVVGAETPEQIAETARLAKLDPLAQEDAARIAKTLGPLLNDLVLTPSRWAPL